MVTILQLKIIGTAMLVLGMLLFLYGVLMLDKKVLATSFVMVIIAVTLLYYSRRMGEIKK
jgi:hypothetical protein